jgi:hypothetical protein
MLSIHLTPEERGLASPLGTPDGSKGRTGFAAKDARLTATVWSTLWDTSDGLWASIGLYRRRDSTSHEA